MLIRLQNHCLNYCGQIGQKNLKYRYASAYPIKKIQINAGLYKPSSFFIQYSLMVANLSGKPSVISYQVHGKRKRQTISTGSTIATNQIWSTLDKLSYEIFPILLDFKTPKWKKKTKSLSYSFRIRHKFKTYDVFDILTSAAMYDTHRGVFLPLSIHIQFKLINSHAVNECYFHLFRLPISLYRRRYRPAFDDKVSFEQYV